MDELRLGHVGFKPRRDDVEVWTGGAAAWGVETLTHAEVVRLHAWLAGWLAEHQPESETEGE